MSDDIETNDADHQDGGYELDDEFIYETNIDNKPETLDMPDAEKTENQAQAVEAPPYIPKTDDNDGIIQEPDQLPQEVQAEMFDTGPVEPTSGQSIELPDYLVDVNSDMPIDDRHKIVLRLAKDYPGRGKGMPQKRIDMLNRPQQTRIEYRGTICA